MRRHEQRPETRAPGNEVADTIAIWKGPGVIGDTGAATAPGALTVTGALTLTPGQQTLDAHAATRGWVSQAILDWLPAPGAHGNVMQSSGTAWTLTRTLNNLEQVNIRAPYPQFTMNDTLASPGAGGLIRLIGNGVGGYAFQFNTAPTDNFATTVDPLDIHPAGIHVGGSINERGYFAGKQQFVYTGLPAHNLWHITDTAEQYAPWTGLTGHYLLHEMDVGAGEGSRHALCVVFQQKAPSPTHIDPQRFYTSIWATNNALPPGDGANGVSPYYSGSYYGFGSNTIAWPGANFLAAVQGIEADTVIMAGASAWYHCTILAAVVNEHATRGTGFDTAIAIGRDESCTETYLQGLTFGGPMGAWPFGPDSTMITVDRNIKGGTADIATGNHCFAVMDFRTARSDYLFLSDHFMVEGDGHMRLTSNHAQIEFNDTAPGASSLAAGLMRIIGTGAGNGYAVQFNTSPAYDFSTSDTAMFLSPRQVDITNLLVTGEISIYGPYPELHMTDTLAGSVGLLRLTGNGAGAYAFQFNTAATNDFASVVQPLNIYHGGIGVSGTLTLNGQTVTLGANDSAGPGYRVLRVPNA